MAIAYCEKTVCGNARRVGAPWSDGQWGGLCTDCRAMRREDAEYATYQASGGQHNFWLWKHHRARGTLDVQATGVQDATVRPS